MLYSGMLFMLEGRSVILQQIMQIDFVVRRKSPKSIFNLFPNGLVCQFGAREKQQQPPAMNR